jgi:hypothetical protein
MHRSDAAIRGDRVPRDIDMICVHLPVMQLLAGFEILRGEDKK